MSRNKIFLCEYFSMHFRIKFLLFNGFPLYICMYVCAQFLWLCEPCVFPGVTGIIWYLVWLWLTFEKPAKHPTISARELMYIEQSLGQSTQVAMPTLKNTPWRSFFTSMPVIAIIVANFCRSWNFYLLVLFQGQYLHSTFDLKIEQVS